MTVDIQLDFFKPHPQPIDFVNARITELDERLGNLRRGIFSRHNTMAKKLADHEDQIAFLKRELKKLREELKKYD